MFLYVIIQIVLINPCLSTPLIVEVHALEGEAGAIKN